MKMAYLAGYTKAMLSEAATELGENVDDHLTVIKLRKLILQSVEYDEETVRVLLEEIKSRVLEERELAKGREEREFELRKLELTSNNDGASAGSSVIVRNKVDLGRAVGKFDQKDGDLSLYLTMFENQATRLGVDREEWVFQLISVLPVDMAQYVSRETQSDDYDIVKELLLRKYKLSPEKFKIMFYQLYKSADERWEDFRYKLDTYFSEWVGGLNIDSFDKLKELIISDQIKRKTPFETKEHFIDKWGKLVNSRELAEKLDAHDLARSELRKPPKSKPVQKFSPVPVRKDFKTGPPNHQKGAPRKNSHFDEPYVRRCFGCNKPGHLTSNCPEKEYKVRDNRDENSKEAVNNVAEPAYRHSEEFVSLGKVNGQPMKIWRDTGATIDVISSKYVEPDRYLGTVVWVRQALDSEFVSLPLAAITVETKNKNQQTVIVEAEAAVINANREYYILGNKTGKQIDEVDINNDMEDKRVHQVVTRSQVIAENASQGPRVEDESEKAQSEGIDILALEGGTELLEIVSTPRQQFVVEQEECSSLKKIWENLGKSTQFKLLENKLLVKQFRDKCNEIRNLIVVPSKYRRKLIKFSHENISCHVGVSKTKDKLFRYYYWPNCYKDVETFVRECDQCQRVGHPNDVKKAEMKLVSIVGEVFSKINIDIVGPLPQSENGNKYLLTAMCLASKYPEAVPLCDMTSESVVKALVEIFCRIGFPKELQCDQGTPFTSVLTTNFLQKFNIRIVHSSVYHPQSNPVERFHRTLKRILSVTSCESGSKWEEKLPMALFTVRTMIHETTGFTPSELVFGKNLRTPETLVYEQLIGESSNPKEISVNEYIFDLHQRLARCQELAISNATDARAKRKVWYDKHTKNRMFKPGDRVLILKPKKLNKLMAKWQGPATVIKKISDTNYLINFDNKEQIYHINMLKQYFGRQEEVNYLNNNGIKETELLKLNDVFQSVKINNDLSEPQRQRVNELIIEFKEVFSMKPGLTDVIVQDIELIDTTPIRARPYKMSPRQIELIDKEVDCMIQDGLIEEGPSDFAHPAILVEALGRAPRLCIDYRKLNKVTKTQYYPLPRLEQRIETVANAKYITCLDLVKGFLQVPLTTRAQEYAAFVTTKGVYRPLRMTFGLKNAPYMFSRLMDHVLSGCEEFAIPFIDDVAIFSTTWEEHVSHVKIVLNRLKAAKLTAKPTKCKFAETNVEYLGHYVGQGKLTPSEAKVKIIQDLDRPKTKREVRALLGLINYYRKYIKNFAEIALPLTKLLKGRVKQGKINWSAECDRALDQLKRALSAEPVLHAPDFKRQFIMQCDASKEGVGICLSQRDEKGDEHPVLFLSRKFTDAETRYCVSEQECLAIIYGVKKLRYYLDNSMPFIIETDHNPLTWLKTSTTGNARLYRWALSLQELNFEVRHKSGKQHTNADFFSRYQMYHHKIENEGTV